MSVPSSVLLISQADSTAWTLTALRTGLFFLALHRQLIRVRLAVFKKLSFLFAAIFEWMSTRDVCFGGFQPCRLTIIEFEHAKTSRTPYFRLAIKLLLMTYRQEAKCQEEGKWIHSPLILAFRCQWSIDINSFFFSSMLTTSLFE